MAARRRSLRRFHFSGTACHEYSYARRMALLALSPPQAFAKAFGEILRGLEQEKHFSFRQDSELIRWLDVVDDRDIEETLTAARLHQGIVTREAATSDVFDYIAMFYNPVRRHGSAGDLSPVEFERRYALSGQ